MELLCPAGNLASLKAALNAGADAVYIGLKNETNARSFAGLNFSQDQFKQAARLVKQQGKKLHLAINTFSMPGEESKWTQTIDFAANNGVDALIIADMSLLDYAHQHYPHIPLHLSVQASVNNLAAITLYHDLFNIERVVLPRVLTMKQIRDLAANSPVDLEVFAFGSLCIMAEGRCHLSSYVTGQSPNTGGSCSPANCVQWHEHQGQRSTHLNGILIDNTPIEEALGYPVVCKGRYLSGEHAGAEHWLESPISLNTLRLVPQLAQAGIASLKIEGRQRSPAYVSQVAKTWRRAIDAYLTNPNDYQVQPQWDQVLAHLSEGQVTTLGAYQKQWQ
ncbi:peptidase U32 family protein [Shewanella sp. NIFS-20-20]|uniref:ubiquinone anaerobic biosynthesis protein UbiU n=1 Tax=Shewanella sp. NIFS-20-20 TaxID=2853806 RepID=UPI001C46CDD9|nr:peptidase U32 family protein [Shewanella sp. NIFS-20-20]MBV7314949.1 U32 family peptidase [Shewanella sp. NIFS-20-20]